MRRWQIGTLVFFVMAIVLSALVACVVTQSTESDNLLVTLPDLGKVQGSITHSAWTNQEVYQFLSIPYAEAPSGNLRFKAPVPKKPWDETVDGTKYGRRCPVSTHVNAAEADSVDIEDCLSLCVYTKNFKANASVMFYIYGGGFYNGTHADHPPHYLMEKDIVLVVPQFRLGALGWMSLRNKKVPGNMGFMDVLTALKWVQANIHNFGGNAANVTVFGQSAGAVQTSLLTMSPGVPDGLFNKVITASGSVFGHWAVNEKPFDLAKSICEGIKCPRGCGDSQAIHGCLMKASVPNIIKVTSSMSFSPSTEDFFGYLPTTPTELAKTYKRKYPVMAGVTRHDGSFVTASIYDGLNAQLKGNWSGITTRALIDMMFVADDLGDKSGIIRQTLTKLLFEEQYLESTDFKASIPAYIDLHGIGWMKSPLLTFLRTSSQSPAGDNYLYSFDYAGEHTRFGYEFGNDWYPFEGGVHHSNDNIYLWSTHKLNEKDTEIAKKMVDIWTSFAITGKPSHGGIDIPKFNGDNGPYFHINEEITIGQDFLDELVTTVRDPKRDDMIRQDVPWGTGP